MSRNALFSADPRARSLRSRPFTFAVLAAVVLLVASVVQIVGVTTAYAEQPPGGTHSYSNMALHAYAKAGETITVSGGPFQVEDPNGGTSTSDTNGSTYTATTAGVWSMTGPDTGTGGTYDWTIDVAGAGGPIAGRVWSDRYFMKQSGSADLQFYLVGRSGYRYDVALQDYNGINSTIQATPFGNVNDTAECAPLYRSVASAAGTATGVVTCGPWYHVFFDEPAADLPTSASSADGDTWILPDVLTADDLTASDFAFTPDALGSAAGSFSYSLPTEFVGGYTLEIDADGDGDYDGPKDRSIRLGADGSGDADYAFDGLDADGAAIAQCTSLNARIHFDKLGEIHVLQGDVEERDSIAITRMNGAGANDATTYWDDSGLSTDARTSVTTPLSALDGVDSSGGVHGWAYDTTQGTNTWGNNRSIDDWAYLATDHVGGELAIDRPCLTVKKTSDAIESARAGDTVTYTVTATNEGEGDYTEAEPARVVDDLADVLDDATFNDDTVATQDGELSYSEPKIAWEGPLAAGDAIELTYSVTFKDGGDQQARNVAFAPSPTNTTNVTPVCDVDDSSGIDPTTGEPCAFVELPLASFTVSKEASTETVTAGDDVTYTVTVINTGSVAYTDERPATFTDDLSAVLDDAEYNDDATEGATFDDPELSWAGALAVGETKTVTYSITVNDTVTGDARLTNAVVPGISGSCDDECTTETSVMAFHVTKTADTPEVVPGDTVTYRIEVENTGQVDYTADDPASFTDDLSEVLDDAAYNDDVAGGASVTDGVLSWSGALAVGETGTITYSVTVDDPGTGNDVLTNAVLTPPDIGGNCAADSTDPACLVRIPDASFEVVKTADSDVVDLGGIVTYTITVTNAGASDYTATAPAAFSDDMSEVLDDASYNGDVTSGAQVDGDALTWSGALGVGETKTITYSVTVNGGGDGILTNVATPAVPGGSCGDDGCRTTTRVSAYTIAKHVDRDSARSGDVVTYTIDVTNTGQVEFTDEDPASFIDDLSDVLDDATYNGDASSGAVLTGTALSWHGAVGIGQSAHVTYTVTVSDRGGDRVLDNVVEPGDPSGACLADGECRTETAIDDPGAAVHTGGHLVDRGGVAPWVLIGGGWVVAALAGAAIMVYRRRRKTH